MKKNVQVQRNIQKTTPCSDLTPTEITGVRTQVRHGVDTKSEFQCLFHWEFSMDLLYFESPKISV